MSQQKLLTVTVPCYNSEAYMRGCVDSLLVGGERVEIIIIDDGSTDRSGELCDELQRRYGCVKVIHQQNGGLSAARNSGINIACGEYITFVDSDDELCRNTLKGNLDFLFAHPEVDMLEYPIEVHAESPKAYMLNFHDEMQHGDVFVDWIRREGYRHCYACNKIYRANILFGTLSTFNSMQSSVIECACSKNIHIFAIKMSIIKNNRSCKSKSATFM